MSDTKPKIEPLDLSDVADPVQRQLLRVVDAQSRTAEGTRNVLDSLKGDMSDVKASTAKTAEFSKELVDMERSKRDARNNATAEALKQSTARWAFLRTLTQDMRFWLVVAVLLAALAPQGFEMVAGYYSPDVIQQAVAAPVPVVAPAAEPAPVKAPESLPADGE